MFYRFVLCDCVSARGDAAWDSGLLKERLKLTAHCCLEDSKDLVGPLVKFVQNGCFFEGKINRLQTAFGVLSPEDDRGGTGFVGLVTCFSGTPDFPTEVWVNLNLADSIKAGDWAVDFVRKSILQSGMKIKEEKCA